MDEDGCQAGTALTSTHAPARTPGKAREESAARRLPGVRAGWRRTLPGPASSQVSKSLRPQGPGQRLDTGSAGALILPEAGRGTFPRVFGVSDSPQFLPVEGPPRRAPPRCELITPNKSRFSLPSPQSGGNLRLWGLAKSFSFCPPRGVGQSLLRGSHSLGTTSVKSEARKM